MTGDQQRLSDAEFERWWRETGEFELQQLLYWRWDPIAISGSFPWTYDEYRSYAEAVVAALRDEASADDVASLLFRIETQTMAMRTSEPTDSAIPAASCIVQWFKASQHRWQELGPIPH